MKNQWKLLAAIVPLALSVACTDAAKMPAEAAMKAAETAMGELKGDVAKLAPDQVKAAQDAFASAKDKIAKEDYKGALATAGEIPAQVKAAVAAAAAKKDELLKAWNEASGGLPKMVEAIKSRLGILAEAKKLPPGIDKAGLAKAQEGVAAIEGGLAKAAEQVKSGGFAEAIAQAKELKAKGAEIMKSIGMGQ
jgi:hypothetical protein